MSTNHEFRVIIVGGGVVGLTLANALEKAGIDYVLLERRSEIAPTIGQSIAAQPNGCRILDQIGVLEEWRKHSQACLYWIERDEKGEELFKTDGVQLGCSARTGYAMKFGERTRFLESLYGNIKNKNNVLVNKNITSVIHEETGVTVLCTDGSQYKGGILAGADGVRSKVRDEMLKLASRTHPEMVAHDRNALHAEYRCLFGIADSPPSTPPGDLDFGYDHGRSSLVFAGAHRKSYFFVFEKLDKVYRGADIPRYTKDDAVQCAEKHATMMIRPDLTIADYWETCGNFTLSSLEEATYELWTWGRIACVGDSVHKMTPNIGAGGNAGIESAAALANAIKAIADESRSKPDQNVIERHLQNYHQKRQKRASAIVNSAGAVSRMQASHSLPYWISAKLARYYPGDFHADWLSDYFCDAERLVYLPPPDASLCGLQPFNPSQGESQQESRLRRALLAIPLFGIFCFMVHALDPSKIIPFLTPVLESGSISWDTNSVPILFQFYRIEALDKILVQINTFFAPAVFNIDSTCRTQTNLFLTDWGVVISIWAFESIRRANIMTTIRLPSLFLLVAQIRGIGVISPLYYFFYYICTPIEKFKASDMRLGRRNYAMIVLPALILSYYIPLYAMEFSPLSSRQGWLYLWQMFPLWFSLLAQLLSTLVPDTTVTDRFKAPKSDLTIIKYTVGILSTWSTIMWFSTVFVSKGPLGFFKILIPRNLPARTTDNIDFAREFLALDALSFFLCTFIWLGYLFADLKYAGLVRASWMKLFVYCICSMVTFGPGAAAGMGWLWREVVLATNRHKNAIVSQ